MARRSVGRFTAEFVSIIRLVTRIFAWLGGAAFVGSLAYLVYFYAYVLGSSSGEPTAVGRNVAINTALFTIFALHHSVLARARVKAHVVAWVGPRSERTVYVWTASILLLAVCVLWQLVPGVVYAVDGVTRFVLHALQVCGIVLTIRGAGVIDALELAGIRQATVRPSTDELKIAGPFRVVRHPIYLGWMLMVFAAPTMTNNRLLFATISSLYLILAIPWEEKSLVAAHGDQYRAYRRTVRWRVLPGIW
jgi:methanethiol S-methyltransferase